MKKLINSPETVVTTTSISAVSESTRIPKLSASLVSGDSHSQGMLAS